MNKVKPRSCAQRALAVARGSVTWNIGPLSEHRLCLWAVQCLAPCVPAQHIASPDADTVQVFRSVLAWCEEHNAPGDFPELFAALRLHHLETFECRSLLAHPLVAGGPPGTAILESLLARIEGSPPPSDSPRRRVSAPQEKSQRVFFFFFFFNSKLC